MGNKTGRLKAQHIGKVGGFQGCERLWEIYQGYHEKKWSRIKSKKGWFFGIIFRIKKTWLRWDSNPRPADLVDS